ncbi:hypothetical protein I302_106453 [Kwoniella bestiolae CBS 10118]|uniref:Uncharacterized protein n=1 Tax=Kwoniella bestiolae CBS 10118 TaxID=1296100 RepID=A0A1B9G1D1_9TREE|nr:hypothetical protein I302_06290 [Kwoniella bestiolae CBS 10118]OCF24829.1 hypothetical protein I302_06290 [Kwoniella bestiolae CBS 10118]
MNYFQIPISESQISAPQDDNKSFFQQLGIDMGWDCTPFDPPFPAYSAYSGDPSLDTYGDSAEYSGEIGSVDNASQGTKRSYDDPNWQDDWSTMDRGGKRQRVYGSTGPENSLDTAQFQAQALGDKSHSSHAGSIPTESHQAPGSLSTTQTNERSGTETKNDEDQIVASATTNKQEMLRVLRTPWTRYKPGKVPDELMQYASEFSTYRTVYATVDAAVLKPLLITRSLTSTTEQRVVKSLCDGTSPPARWSIMTITISVRAVYDPPTRNW